MKTAMKFLHANGQIKEKECLETIDTGAPATVAKSDIAAELPEIVPTTKCSLQTASPETLSIG
jgi:hypothetical protein